jgi:hypothetical protein
MFANVVVVNRIKWVEDLRKDISEFVAAYAAQRTIFNELRQARNEEDKTRIKALLAPTGVDVSQKRFLIRLKLNPDNPKQNKLIEVLGLSMDHADELHKGNTASIPTRDYANLVADAAREVLSEEWQRAKRLRK